jgi:hypothetical protein
MARFPQWFSQWFASSSPSRRLVKDGAFVLLLLLVITTPIVLFTRQGSDSGAKRQASVTARQQTASGTATPQHSHSTGQTTIPAKQANCSPDVVPIGQANPSAEAEPMGPNWCFPLVQMPTTRVAGANSWLDDFATNEAMGHLNNGEMGYRVYDQVSGSKSQVFVNNNHWMPDVLVGKYGNVSSMIRPDTAFKFENGTLIVETDVAAGIPEYSNGVWPEIDISTSPNPTYARRNAAYGYDMFTGSWVLGCRLQGGDRFITCSMFNPQSQSDADAGRLWEINWFRPAPGGAVNGGGPFDKRTCNGQGQCTTLKNVFRLCQHNQMDMFCRDRFRLELTQHTLTVYVNGFEYMQATLPGNAAIPDAMLHGDNYAYFTSFVSFVNNETLHGGDVVRFHWGRVAVNPTDGQGHSLPLSAAPSFCLGRDQNTCPMTGMNMGS